MFEPNSIWEIDEQHMRTALRMASLAKGATSPNPLVGAVVLNKDCQVVGTGFHRRAGMPHAEVEALKVAGSGARGGVLYVNLEPCTHYGRTGPCSEEVIRAGIKRIVVAMRDPNPLVCGKGIHRLKCAGVEVVEGVLAKEAALINEVFIKYIRTGTPFVTLKLATSLDGKIAANSGDSRWITGESARKHVHELRSLHDAILVGVDTIINDNPRLTVHMLPTGKNPRRIVLDSKLRIPEPSWVLQSTVEAGVVIATTTQAPQERIRRFEQKGVEVLICGDGPRVDLNKLLKHLAENNLSSLMVEGGARVSTAFLQESLVDKVYWFIAPLIVGGERAPNAYQGFGVKTIAEAIRLKEVVHCNFEQDCCVTGYPDGSAAYQCLQELLES